ncbi:MAG: glycosyltransferase family 39 protein [bacterium]
MIKVEWRRQASALIPAAVLRLILGVYQTHQPVFEKYLTLGRELLSDRINTPFSSSPLYTVWIGILNSRCGLNADIIRWIQFVLGLLSVFLVVKITSKIWNPVTGTLAGLFYGCLTPPLLYESDLVTSSLEIILVLIALSATLAAAKNLRPYQFIVAGLTMGLAVTIRPNLILLCPLIAVWLWITVEQKFSAVVGFILFGLSTTAVIAPITLFNYRRSGEIIWVTVSGGSVFYSSNNYRAEGLGYSPPQALTEIESDMMKKGSETFPVEHELFKYLAERASGRKLTYHEMSSFYFDEAFYFLKKSPFHGIQLFMSKFFYLFNNYEVLDTASLINASSRIKQIFPFLPGFGLVSLLSLLRIGRFRKRNSGEFLLLLFIIPHVLTGVLFYVNGRLRVSMMPFLAMLAAAAAVDLIQSVKNRKPNAWIKVIWLAGIAVFVYGWNDAIRIHKTEQTPAFLHTMKGLTLLKSGRIVEAASEYEAAVIGSPLGAVEAYTSLAGIYRIQGRMEQSSVAARHAVGIWTPDELVQLIEQREPDFLRRPEVQMLMAASFQRLGKRDEAVDQYEKILNERPWLPDALYNRAMLYLQETPPDCVNAAALIEEALNCGLKLDINSTNARKKLQNCQLHLGLLDKASLEQAQIEWEESLPLPY